MPSKPSERIISFVDALPLFDGARVLEIGCGPGIAAREISQRVGDGFVLALDRSEKVVSTARRLSASQVEAGRLEFRACSIETFELASDEERFDICFAMRVGAFDGRHPEIEAAAITHVRESLRTGGRFFIDTGTPLQEVQL